MKCVLKTQVKLPITFLITITENGGFSFSRNCLWLEFNYWNKILWCSWKVKYQPIHNTHGFQYIVYHTPLAHMPLKKKRIMKKMGVNSNTNYQLNLYINYHQYQLHPGMKFHYLFINVFRFSYHVKYCTLLLLSISFCLACIETQSLMVGIFGKWYAAPRY